MAAKAQPRPPLGRSRCLRCRGREGTCGLFGSNRARSAGSTTTYLTDDTYALSAKFGARSAPKWACPASPRDRALRRLRGFPSTPCAALDFLRAGLVLPAPDDAGGGLPS